MSNSRFLVLEFGSKSLKIHRKSSSGQFQKATVAWRLGHEVYREGAISPGTRQQVLAVIHGLVRKGFRKEGMLAIATGAVRDAPDRAEFLAYLKDTVGLEMRVISGREEASLLAQGFMESAGERPALLIDIGGGSLQMVYLGTDRTLLRDSLPLGAIRLHYLGTEADGKWNGSLVGDWIDSVLRDSAVLQLPQIYATGGPVKAISQVLGTNAVTPAVIAELEERVLRDGPPPGLSSARRQIFLPGIMVVNRLLLHCRAEVLSYRPLPIGKIFLARFLGQKRDGLSDEMNVKLLQNIRITKLYHTDPAADDTPPVP